MERDRLLPHEMMERLLAHEAEGQGDPSRLADAAQQVYQKLEQQLARLVGPRAPRAVLDRAIRVSRADYPFLQGVEAGPAGEGCFRGLEESLRGVDSAAARRGLTAVLATALEVLANYIGQDFMLSLARRAWPEVALGEKDVNSDEGER